MPSPRILIADPEPLIASLVSGLVKQDGYEPRVADSSSLAIQQADDFRPQFLIIDPIMPGLSGVEAATRISQKAKCKVLFLTPLSSDNDFREVLRGLRQQGCDCEALPKPFSKELLLEHIHRRIGAAIVITDALDTSSDGHRTIRPAAQPQTIPGPPPYRRAEGDYEALLKICTLHIYQKNAFRLTGLDTDSPLRDISREGEKLEMMIKLGAKRPPGGIFPLPEAQDIGSVKSALQSLREPEQRLLHEFFWFWPVSASSKDDPGLQALRQGNYQAALDLWTKAKGNASGIAIHNLAVFHHLGALDTVIRRSAARTPPTAEDQFLWSSAYRYWKTLLERAEFWDSLVTRIRTLNDPRLKIEIAHRIWSSLPNAILSINACLAIAAAERGDFEEAGRQRRLLYTSAFGGDFANVEIHRALTPLRDDIERLCDTAEKEARARPKTANTVVRKLFADKAKLIQTFNYLIGTGDPMCDAVHDRVAEAGRVCMIEFVNETEDWETTHLLFEECLALAEGKALRAKLEADLEIIASNLEVRRHAGKTPTSGASTQTTARTPQPSQAASEGQSHPTVSGKTQNTNRAIGVFVVIVVFLFAIAKGCEDSPRSPTASPEPETSLPSPPFDSGSTQSNPRSNTRPFAGSESRDLKAQIDAGRVRLTALEYDLDQSKLILQQYEARLNSDKATLERMKRDQSFGFQVDVDEYERIRNRYNMSVNLYNAQVETHNATLTEYRQLLASTNAKIARYNAQGRSR